MYLRSIYVRFCCAAAFGETVRNKRSNNTIPMKTDIEIARETKLKSIREIAARVGFPEEELFNYGKYIAKVPYKLIDEKQVAKNHLILVTAITATKAGVGKTTVSIGLGMGLNHIGKKAIIALREPSLGPCFGMKGGATAVSYTHLTLPTMAVV